MNADGPGLLRDGGVVVLSGLALRAARDCAVIAADQRKRSGIPYQSYAALASEFNAAVSASVAVAGHSDTVSPAASHPVAVEKPTVPITQEVADALNVSLRQARRLAQKLGGEKIGGRWFITDTALREHIEGLQ